MAKGSKKNKVIIYVWKSNLLEGIAGHIAIKTPNRYMSLWPKKSYMGKIKLFNTTESELKKNLTEDNLAERKPPSQTIMLYALNIKNMEDRFDNIAQDKRFCGWTIVGNNRLLNNGNTHSCASLAYHLLLAGEIYDLISTAYSSNFSSIVTPNELCRVVGAAKKNELQKYPDTRKYDNHIMTSRVSSCYSSLATLVGIAGLFSVGAYYLSYHSEDISDCISYLYQPR